MPGADPPKDDRQRLKELIAKHPSGAGDQLAYLEEVLEVIGGIGHPRFKPLKKKLNKAYANLGRGAEEGKSPEELVHGLASDLDVLRRQTYDLLSNVTSQLRTTLRSKRGSFAPAERQRLERLESGLGHFSAAMRQMISANENRDPDARARAQESMRKAHLVMAE